jgi:hypothetical protein
MMFTLLATTGFWDWLSANLPAIMSALIAAWSAWQATQAKNIGNHNTAGIGAVHDLANSRLANVEGKLSDMEGRLSDAHETIRAMGNAASYRDGQDAGPGGDPARVK